MNDCSNAVIRDQLPDLVHERLEASARAAIVAHVATCEDCRAELQLLRDMRGMFEQRTPRVDVAYVLGALPKAPAKTPANAPARVQPRRRVWADWRIAAAVTVLVAGGSSAVLLERGTPAAALTPAAVTATVPAHSAPAAATTPASNAGVPATASNAGATSETESQRVAASNASGSANDHPADAVGGGSRLSDLNEDQLQTLLKDIDKLQAVPVTEPDPVVLRVNTQSSTEGA